MKLFWMLILPVCLCTSEAHAQWAPLGGNPSEADVRCIAGEAGGKVLFAGTRGGVWRSQDGGETWKRVLGLGRGDASVNRIELVAADPRTVYAATDEGVYRSADGGGRWKRIFQRADESEERALWVKAAAVGGAVAVGTSGGLFWSRDEGRSWARVEALGGDAVFQIESEPGGTALVASARGLWRCSRDFGGCESLHPLSRDLAEDSDLQGNAQAAVEDLPAATPVYFGSGRLEPGRIWLLNGRRVVSSRDGGRTWSPSDFESLPANAARPPVVLDERSGEAAFVTEQGVLMRKASGEAVSPANWGLPTAGVRDIWHDEAGDALLAATDKGLFKLTHPGVVGYFRSRSEGAADEEIFALFEHEPSVTELHAAAIRYAEVNPSKIAEWRRAASLKAWMPTLSVSKSLSEDQNIDLDRGGTGDPDHFIFGPEEQSRDTALHVAWNLGDIVYNDDQTTIDNRSKLMVQLRDDLLNQLNHLYFARRRLQIEIAMRRSEDLGWKVEKELQLQEYTAGIDALTGGYLSKKLKIAGN